MKKVGAVFLFLLMFLIFSGCDEKIVSPFERSTQTVSETTFQTKSTPLKPTDLNIYNRQGFLLSLPPSSLSEMRKKFSELPPDEYTSPMTSKGVSVGDDALPALKKYNLINGCSVFSLDGKTFEILSDLQKVISDDGKNIIILPLDNSFLPTDLDSAVYKIVFTVFNRTVFDVAIEN